MTKNSFSNGGVSNSQGSMNNGGAGPSARIVTGVFLGGQNQCREDPTYNGG